MSIVMRSVDVEVFDDGWVPLGKGTVYQSLEEDQSLEEQKDKRIESGVWGRFLDHRPRYQDVEFYRLCPEGEEEIYVKTLEHRDMVKHYHNVMYPICKNVRCKLVDKDGNEISESQYEAYKKRKVYLRME